MAGERVTLWTSAAAAGATFVAVAISAAIIWNSAGKQRTQFVAELAVLNAKLDAVNAKIDKAGETVTEIKKITSVETTTKALEQLNSEIKKTNDGLATLQQTSSLDGVKTMLAKLDAEIGRTGAALAGLKKSATADLVKGDLAGIENRLTSLKADIETKLAATAKSLAEIKAAKQPETGAQAAGDAARDQAIAKLESAIGELKAVVADNASSQNKSLAEIARSIAALKTTAAAAQMAAQQAAQKAEKAVAVARPPAPTAPEVTASIPVVQPLIVNFGGAGRGKLDAQTNKVIANLRTIMKGKHGCAILVAGYTDTLGRDDVNLDVSKERADLVAAELKTAFAGQNVRIDSVGWGERKLKVWTPDGRRQMANRRVAVSVDCNG
jgi:outer membrane protein OmpA-like peptidoglycan-associated protein